MITYRLPSESYPMSQETALAITILSATIKKTGSTLTAKRILRMADKDFVTSETVSDLYSIESRYVGSGKTDIAEAIKAVRVDLAQPFSNEFYKS